MDGLDEIAWGVKTLFISAVIATIIGMMVLLVK